MVQGCNILAENAQPSAFAKGALKQFAKGQNAMRSRYLLAIIIIFAVVLVGCIEVDEALLVENEEVEEIAEEIESIEEVAARHSWAEAYFDALGERVKHDPFNLPTHILLIDIDFDGVPEMFLSHLGVVNSSIFHGYSYQNGEVINIQIYDDFLPPELSLLKHINTCELAWLAEGSFRQGGGVGFDFINEFVDFSDFSNVRREKVFTRYERFMYDGIPIYEFIGSEFFPNEDDIKLVTFYDGDSTILDNYEVIEVQYLFSFVSEFLNDGEWQLTPETLDRNKLISFFNEWE